MIADAADKYILGSRRMRYRMPVFPALKLPTRALLARAARRVSTALFLGLLILSGAHAQQALTPVAGRPMAPDFTLADVDGKRHRLSDQRGKVVFVNFWATWCPPCRKEMPSMQRAWDKLKGRDFVMYAVAVGEDAELVSNFAFEIGTKLTFPLLLDRESDVVRQWRVPGLPTTFIVGADGRIDYRAVGERDWDSPKLLEAIRALLPASAPAQRVKAEPR